MQNKNVYDLITDANNQLNMLETCFTTNYLAVNEKSLCLRTLQFPIKIVILIISVLITITTRYNKRILELLISNNLNWVLYFLFLSHNRTWVPKHTLYKCI